jgi:hypothetical protein
MRPTHLLVSGREPSPSRLPAGWQGSWVYLGTQAQRRDALAVALGEGVACRDTARPFREAMARLLPGFEAALEGLLAALPEDTRRLCPASECNFFNLPGLALAALSFLFRDLARRDRPLLFVVDAPRLWNFLLDRHGADPGLRFLETEPWPLPGDDDAGELAAAVAAYAARRGARPPEMPREDLTVLHCWGNWEAIQAGRVLEQYYGRLPAALAAKGERLLPIVVPLVPDERQDEARALLRRHLPQAVFQEELLAPGDLESLAGQVAGLPRTVPPLVVDGVDVADLFGRREIIGGGGHSLFGLLYAGVFRTLADRGARVGKFVYTFENQVWERQALRALGRHFPDCRTIGFQHTLVPRHWGLTPPGAIAARLDAPDVIVANGAVSLDVLAPVWRQRVALRLGPALRQAYLHDGPEAVVRSRVGLTLGIAATYFLDQSRRLMEGLARLLAAMPDLRAVVRPHPCHDAGTVRELLDLAGSPDRVGLSQGGQTDFLGAIDALAGAPTSLLTEAALAGLPVFQVHAFHGLDLVFEGLAHPLVDDLAELRPALTALLAGGPARPRPSRQAIGRIFHPVTAAALAAFD